MGTAGREHEEEGSLYPNLNGRRRTSNCDDIDNNSNNDATSVDRENISRDIVFRGNNEEQRSVLSDRENDSRERLSTATAVITPTKLNTGKKNKKKRSRNNSTGASGKGYPTGGVGVGGGDDDCDSGAAAAAANNDNDTVESPFDLNSFRDANWFSQMTFMWVTGLVRYAYRHNLSPQDVWNLRDQEKAHICGAKLQTAWEQELQRPRSERSLTRAILRVWRSQIFTILLLKTAWLASVLFSNAYALPGIIRVLGKNTTQLEAEGGTVSFWGLEVATMGLVYTACFAIAECAREFMLELLYFV